MRRRHGPGHGTAWLWVGFLLVVLALVGVSLLPHGHGTTTTACGYIAPEIHVPVGNCPHGGG